jgi:hypothetical protein
MALIDLAAPSRIDAKRFRAARDAQETTCVGDLWMLEATSTIA